MICTHCAKELVDEARFCSGCGTPQEPGRPGLSRPVQGRKIAGVCAGFARYFEMDVTLVRILWILVTIFPPVPGIIAYIVCWIAMPVDLEPSSFAPPHRASSANPAAEA